MAQLALPALVASTALQGVGSVMRGREESMAARFEQEQANIQAQNFRTASAESEARRREELTSSLETIQALRAGRGLSGDSPTGMAILDNVTQNAERDIAIDRLGYTQRAEQARLTSILSGRRAQTSLLSGYLGAGAAAADAGFRGATMGMYRVPTPRTG